ncbi:DUF6708 domain-containing protein [Stenotrophomonas maltophilia]|uniref:DUF6708 domain-containing protein n=1 Tax=Stenotrophomonas maltophilia TaxID=40324 RepID=UPI000B0F7A2B|nr:DUF6708 domain-containing protein [Stenotrophomonas maltophilia]
MSQFAGWLAQRYRNNRPLTEYEKAADVRRFDSSTFVPIDKGIIAIDDDCIEYVDRHFLYRGWALMGASVFIALGLLFVVAILHATSSLVDRTGPLESGDAYAIVGLIALALAFLAFIFCKLLLRDVLRYQYYPVRFDRVAQQVHVFTGKRDKVVSVPWRDVRFVIGRDKPAGPDEGCTYDLRGLVMDGEQVVYTFAVGSDSGPNPAITLAHWEMIRRFMEEGRSALPFPPLQLYTSVAPTLRNAFIIHVSSAGAGLMWIALPITLPWALFRFLTMKLCRKPVWPAAVVRRGASGSSSVPPLRAPAVYGRVDHSGGRADEMERFWKESIAAAMARNDGVRQLLNESGGKAR